MKHKTAELEGALLNAAVAKAEGLPWRVFDSETRPLYDSRAMVYIKGGPTDGGQGGGYPLAYDPSKNWAYGGPIIERERIDVDFGSNDAQDFDCLALCAGFAQYGPTPLTAAMRAYTASVFGEEVELP